ncbi:MAG: glycosyltransferase [Paracoccaceae bacterium]
MIFVTTGTQLPFPRLIAAMNDLAPELDEKIIAQIGPDDGTYSNLEIADHLAPAAFEDTFRQARIIVAHAGIGTILSAKRLAKPLVLVPRRHDQGEHRNDHQIATAQAVAGRTGLHVAWQVSDLKPLLTNPDLTPADDAPGPAHDALTGFLKSYIDGL